MRSRRLRLALVKMVAMVAGFGLTLSSVSVLAQSKDAPATKPAARSGAPAKSTPAPKPAIAKATPAPLLDINSAGKADLIALNGIGDVYAQKIIDGRPYARKDELVTKNVLPQATYDKVKDKIIARQAPAKKK